MIIALVQLAIPLVAILAFLVFKLNHNHKKMLFKIPVLITSTALSLLIGHLAPGVMGFYSAAILDLMLYPFMVLIKKATLRKEQKLQRVHATSKPNLVLQAA